MLPGIASINTNPITVPLVNTPLPGSAVTRVPVDTVAPSVSNAQVNNNASNNNAIVAAANADQPQTVSSEEEVQAQANAAQTQNTGASLGAQATFLAQLIGQDVSLPPETAGILVQYEKLTAFSQVKYKPSNAFKPQAAPSGVFGRIMMQERASHTQVQTAPVHQEPAPVAEEKPVPALQKEIHVSAQNYNSAPSVAHAYSASARPAYAGGTNIADSA